MPQCDNTGLIDDAITVLPRKMVALVTNLSIFRAGALTWINRRISRGEAPQLRPNPALP
jgi:hypothetical protein